MKKRFLVGVMMVSIMMLLSGCCISHEWQEPTCTTPKTCSKCGKTEGEALGHAWLEATCSAPKTCSVCGETEGDALPHTWKEATCSVPKTCSICGETEGEILEHKLSEATYQLPATCSVCGVTEGDVLKPIASKEEIAEVQARIDVFVETYNYGNQIVIDELSSFIAEGETDEGLDSLIHTFEMEYSTQFKGKFDFGRCATVIPMAFFNNVNGGLIKEYSFEDYVFTDADTVNAYLRVAQADESNMTTGGIMFYDSMEYVKDIALGNPTVLDVITYKEPVAMKDMKVKVLSYGILDVNGETYYIYMLGEHQIIDICPADREYFND